MASGVPSSTTTAAVAESPRRNIGVKTWLDYVAALIRRGSLTLWVTEEAGGGMACASDQPACKSTGLFDLTIETGLALRLVLHINMRTDHSAGGKSKVRFPHFNINRDVSSTLCDVPMKKGDKTFDISGRCPV